MVDNHLESSKASENTANLISDVIPKTVCNVTRSVNSIILQPILPVRLQWKDKMVITLAFYDNGSSGCFLLKDTQTKLNAKGVSTKVQLGTMHGQDMLDSEMINNLLVLDIDGNNGIELPKTYTVGEIPVTLSQVPTPEIVSKWEHLQDIAKKIPQLIQGCDIGLLIGSNCPVALGPLEVKPSEGNGPFAMRLPHGWTVCGPVAVEESLSTNEVSVNRITVREVERFKEIFSPQTVLEMFERDFNEDPINQNSEEYGLSQDDRKFIEIVNDGISNVNGHYQIPLPFRKEHILFPDNRLQAVKRCEWQKKKMSSDSQYYEHYKRFIQDNIDKGFIEKVPENASPEPGHSWYLPHHGVYHPRKLDKIRVVFDCSAQYQGISLNNQLLQGPNLTNSLIGVLTRFRDERIAFMGDIESMFHQVMVPPHHRDFLRLLWWKDGDIDNDLEEFRMCVHLFGAASSPSCSNFALKKTADESEEEFGKTVANVIRNNFYVDDCLKSVKTPEIAKDLIRRLQGACLKGGFRLTKFICSDKEVLESIPEDERAKEVRELDLNLEPTSRTSTWRKMGCFIGHFWFHNHLKGQTFNSQRYLIHGIVNL
ncbi:uncharacterized protein LOC126828362 [Patella vulgata]|uniref:uncharacterized protein LOC126828362 n=1 Tax=Patella vulgata TaxID=6465 RepID=UPI00217FB3B8|nr:uncharacterized protein LOC126828362 [Patella vulgata]